MTEERTEYTTDAARIAELEATVTEATERISYLNTTNSMRRTTIEEQTARIAELTDALERKNGALHALDGIASQLTARIAELEADIARKNGALHALDVEVQRQNETIARLEQDNRRLRHLDAMPVDALRRYWAGTMYDTRTSIVGYGAENYDEDETAIGEWLNSLDGDA